MSAGERTASLKLFGWVLAPLATLGMVEVLVLAPAVGWSEPLIWLVALLGTGMVVLLVWLAALVIDWGLSVLGRNRPPGSDVALWLVTIIVGVGQSWELIGSRLPVPGKLLKLLVLVVVLSICYVVIRVFGSRLGNEPKGLGLGFAAVLAGLIFFQAVRQNLLWSGTYASGKPLVLGLVGLYVVVALVVLLWGGARTAVGAGALLFLGVVLVRVTTTNAFDLHVMEKADSPPAPGPPVLLIVLDTFRADALDLSRGAGSLTPNLARLASEADVYTHAISNASWTLPGHASIFTGQPLARHRTDYTTQPGFHASLPPDLPTVHQIFKANGYRTSCVAANGVLSPATGLLQGCQRYCRPGRLWLASTLPFQLTIMVRQSRRKGVGILLVEMIGLYNKAEADEIVDQALEEIPEDPRAFYVFLNFLDTHPPYPTIRDTLVRERLSYRRDLLLMFAGLSSFEAFAQPHAKLLLASYQAQVQNLDRELGRLFDALRQRGLYDQMVIVVTADHGEAFWENRASRSYYGHHGAYEPVVHIPLIVKHPGQRDGSVFHHYVQQVSILPALLKTAGLAPLPGSENAGLEENAARASIVTEWYPPPQAERDFLPWMRFGVYKDHYKYVLENKTHESLFDLEQDLYESVNVIEQKPDLAGELRQALVVSLDQAAHKHGTSGQPNHEMEEQLRALGYVN